MKILFKYPTRSRPEWFIKTLGLYYARVSDKCNFEFVVTLNDDDESMKQMRVVSLMKSITNLNFYYGDHQDKIDACNADVDKCKDWDILILVSDDMIPNKQDFDLDIVKLMQDHFPDTDGAIHLNDGKFGKNRTITLSIIGRKLYERFNYVYHPSYRSFYCDNEFTDVVKALGKCYYDNRVLIHHDWCGGPNSKDALYRRNSAMGDPDKQTYLTRKAAGFPMEIMI